MDSKWSCAKWRSRSLYSAAYTEPNVTGIIKSKAMGRLCNTQACAKNEYSFVEQPEHKKSFECLKRKCEDIIKT
jgi:hypothetical protein